MVFGQRSCRQGASAGVSGDAGDGSRVGSRDFWVFWVGSFCEFVGWLLGRVPLDHSPSANITIDTAAVSNGQSGIAHEVLRPAVPADKLIDMGACRGAHRGIIGAKR